MSRVKRAIKTQRETIEFERKWWSELKELADAGKVQEFYAHYAAYLEACNIVSPGRVILHKMAKAVADGKRD